MSGKPAVVKMTREEIAEVKTRDEIVKLLNQNASDQSVIAQALEECRDAGEDEENPSESFLYWKGEWNKDAEERKWLLLRWAELAPEEWEAHKKTVPGSYDVLCLERTK
jgi:hypothetical protein